MGTEVLRPQDCLIDRIGVAPVGFHRRRSCYGNGNGNGNPRFRKPVFRQDQKKRFNQQSEPSISKRSSSSEDFKTNHDNSHHMMGHVAILRRGESLGSKMNGRDLIVCGTGRLGPDPEMIRVGDLRPALACAGGRSDVYAGSAFAMSPSPSSLPLPSFFNKKQVSKIADDSATRDLRRLLRLD